MAAQHPENSIWEIGRFDAHKVRELVGRSKRADRSRPVQPGETGDIRIHATSSETTWLMQAIVAHGRLDAALGDEGGYRYLDVRNGDGVIAEVVELVTAAIAEHHVSFANVCVGRRTLSFYQVPERDLRPLAA